MMRASGKVQTAMADTPAQERLSFDQAVRRACDECKAAFAAVPVFGEDDQTAEGARVFIIDGEGAGGHRVRYIAGPFFSSSYAANELLDDAQIPDRVRELRFLPTTCREEWLSDQIQVLIGKLVQAAQVAAPGMPDYLNAPVRAAAPEVVFPFSRIGRMNGSRAGDEP